MTFRFLLCVPLRVNESFQETSSLTFLKISDHSYSFDPFFLLVVTMTFRFLLKNAKTFLILSPRAVRGDLLLFLSSQFLLP